LGSNSSADLSAIHAALRALVRHLPRQLRSPPATLERRLRDAVLQDFLQHYAREYRHHSRIRTGEVLPLDESVLTYTTGRFERTITTGKESQRAVNSALAEVEERQAELTTRAELSELLVTIILTDAVARGGNQENPSRKRGRLQ
jgi:hypothetical protein